MTDCKYTIKSLGVVERVVELKDTGFSIQILVNGELVCAFNNGHDYLDLYYPQESTGLEKENGFLKVAR